MDSVQFKNFGIASSSVIITYKLKRVNLCGFGIGDVAFHDPPEGTYDKTGKGYRSEVIQTLRAALLGWG